MCLVFSCFVLSCFVLPYLISSLILSFLVLPFCFGPRKCSLQRQNLDFRFFFSFFSFSEEENTVFVCCHKAKDIHEASWRFKNILDLEITTKKQEDLLVLFVLLFMFLSFLLRLELRLGLGFGLFNSSDGIHKTAFIGCDMCVSERSRHSVCSIQDGGDVTSSSSSSSSSSVSRCGLFMS